MEVSRFIQYVFFLSLYFLPNKSFPIILRIRPIGVTTRKKIIPITIGETIAPKINPNLNQMLLSGVKSFEFNNPKIKKDKEIIADQILIEPSKVKGHKLIIKKTTKKTKPKLLFEPIFTLVLCSILFF